MFAPRGEATEVTETYRHAPYTGMQAFLYDTVASRPSAMVKGMQQSLARIKHAMEA